MSIEQLSIQESFILNDIILRINATDIQVFDQRFVDTYSTLRENTTLSMSSTAALATYVVTFAFDREDVTDKDNLIRVCAELAKYPFVFIKSQRLDQFIPSVSKTLNSYNIFGVKEWTLKNDSRAKNTIFLTLDLIYFNHIPYVKDFQFITYEASTSLSNSRVKMGKDNLGVTLRPVDNLYESEIFSDYFYSDYMGKTDKVFQLEKAFAAGTSGEILFGSPEIIQATGENATKPYEVIANNVGSTGFEDLDIILISYANNHKAGKGNKENDFLNFWICYRDVPITLITDKNGNKVFDVQSISITKKNNIIANQLQMYREPFIQYLGNNPATMSIDISINNSAFEYIDFGQDENLKPYEVLAGELRKAETFKVIGGNKMPFKAMRVRSLLNVLADSNYFILENESSVESSEDQGKQSVTINLIESDITPLVGSANLNQASMAIKEKDTYPAILVAAELLKSYAEHNNNAKNTNNTAGGIIPKDQFSTLVSDATRQEVDNKKSAFLSDAPQQDVNIENLKIATQVNSIVAMKVVEKNSILSSGVNGTTSLHSIVAFLFIQSDKFLKSIPGVSVPKYASYSDGLIKISEALKKIAANVSLEAPRIDTNSSEFMEFFGAITMSLETLLQKNYSRGYVMVDTADSEYSDLYTNVLTSAFTNLSVKGMKLGFNELKGESIADFELYKSLLAGYKLKNKDKENVKGKTDYLGETDARKFSPFFFLNQDAYMDATSLITLSSAVSAMAGPALENAEMLFNKDGKTITDTAKYIPLYEEKEITSDSKKIPTKTPKSYDPKIIKKNLDQITKMTEIAYSTYLRFRDANINHATIGPMLKKFSMTKELLYTMISIESGGDPNAHRKGSVYYGLLQIREKWWHAYAPHIPFSYWNNPEYNTMASLNLIYKSIVPGLLGKEAKSLDLNPNSFFNFYMMYQQGSAGYMSIINLFQDSATRNRIVADTDLKHRMQENFPGQNAARTAWDYRVDTWIQAWKNKFLSSTGQEPIIFGYTEPNKVSMTYAANAKELTLGIGAPTNVERFAIITKKTDKSFPTFKDGDTIVFDPKYFNIDGTYEGSSLRIYAMDTPESSHWGSNNLGQKYSKDATLIGEDVLRKMKYPISLYSKGKDFSGTRDMAFIVDANGSDYTYEMIKNGITKYSPIKDSILQERSATYRQVYQETKSLLNKDNLDTSGDATKKNIGGGEAATTFDIQSLEQQVLVATANSPKEMDTLERATALLNNKEEDVYETRPADGLLSKKPLTPIRPLQIDINKPAMEFDEETNTQYRCMRTGNHISTGLDLAVPTVKIYVVEGMRDDWFARYHIQPPRETNLYEIKGVTDVRISTPTEDNPVSVAAFTILNPGSIYTDLAALARRGVNYLPTYDQNNLDANYFDKIGRLRLVAGTRIHVRIGYSNNPNDLETIFNGEIVEVEGEDVLDIIAEGYGRELIAIDHAVEAVQEIHAKSSSTNLVIHKLLQAEEIFHLGLKSHVKNSVNPVSRNILDGVTVDKVDTTWTDNFKKTFSTLYHWLLEDDPNGVWLGDWWALSSELFTNIYSPIIQNMDSEMGGDLRFTQAISTMKPFSLSFPIYKSTIWKSLREVQYRHPGTYMNVMNYKERGSIFFGIKEQLYIATDPPLSTFTGSTESFKTYNKVVNSIKHKLLKPATDMHLITSERDIISNEIRLNGGFKTKVDVRYFDDEPSVDDMETGSGFKYFSAQLDDNLRPNAIRSTTLEAKSCDHEFMAWRYGTSELQRQAERMYDGRIIIVGNPYMKAGDYAYLSDGVRGLNGVIKIRECEHFMNDKDGYITVITPGLFVESRVYRYSNLYTKLGLAWTMAANRIKIDAHTGFYDTRKIKYTTTFMEILTNKSLAKKLYDGPLSEGSRGALATDVALTTIPGIVGSIALYRAFPWLTAQVVGLSSTIASSSVGGAIGGAAGTARAIVGATARSLLGLGIEGGGLLGIISRVALTVMDGVIAGVARGVSVAAYIASSTALATTGALLIGAGILALYMYQTIEKINQTRQPIVMYPLLNNGIPYQSGLFGYELNTFGESFSLEFGKTMQALKVIMNAGRARFFDATGSQSVYAQVDSTLTYLQTVNKTVSTNAFDLSSKSP